MQMNKSRSITIDKTAIWAKRPYIVYRGRYLQAPMNRPKASNKV